MTTTPVPPSTARDAGSDRLRAVLAGAVDDRVVTQAQAAEIQTRFDSAGDGRAAGLPMGGRGRLAEVAGYAGAALVLGAAALFLATEWSDLGRGARAGVLIGAALALAAAGCAVLLTARDPLRTVATDPHSARRRLVSTVWALAAAALAGGVGVLADHDSPWLAAAVGLVAAAGGYAVVPAAPGHVAAAVAATVLAASAVDELWDAPGAEHYAVAFVVVGVGWAALTAVGAVRERDLGFAVAGLLSLVGAQTPVVSGEATALGYALTAAVAVAGYGGYLALRSWPVLAAGVVATTLVVPEALHDWTDGSVSVAAALLVAGLTLLAASAAGLRLRSVAR